MNPSQKVIITAAIIGSTPTREQSHMVPITPEEIADSAVEAYHAGAAIAHIHVRDPVTGKHTNEFALFEEVVERVRSQCDMVINLTTSYGGTLIIREDGEIDHEASCLLSPEKRVAHVLELKPELCSLDISTVSFTGRLFVNARDVVRKMAELIKDSPTKPEIELFDLGHIRMANELVKDNLIQGTPHFQLCMGTSGSLAATPQNAVHFIEQLPNMGTWSIFGVAKDQFPMVAMGALMGGHVRVGLEDNLYMKKGVLAESNAQLVTRAVEILNSLNMEVATAQEAREMLELVQS